MWFMNVLFMNVLNLVGRMRKFVYNYYWFC